jgi:hypothetical protein
MDFVHPQGVEVAYHHTPARRRRWCSRTGVADDGRARQPQLAPGLSRVTERGMSRGSGRDVPSTGASFGSDAEPFASGGLESMLSDRRGASVALIPARGRASCAWSGACVMPDVGPSRSGGASLPVAALRARAVPTQSGPTPAAAPIGSPQSSALTLADRSACSRATTAPGLRLTARIRRGVGPPRPRRPLVALWSRPVRARENVLHDASLGVGVVLHESPLALGQTTLLGCVTLTVGCVRAEMVAKAD